MTPKPDLAHLSDRHLLCALAKWLWISVRFYGYSKTMLAIRKCWIMLGLAQTEYRIQRGQDLSLHISELNHEEVLVYTSRGVKTFLGFGLSALG
jgi:hypothetical protein